MGELTDKLKASMGVPSEGAPTPELVVEWDRDLLITDEDLSSGDHESDEISRAIEGLGIVEAYNLWCGKMTPKVGKKTESIMCSCPNPSHPDDDPSAWMNSTKNVGHCGPCGIGFDVYDLYAWHSGRSVPGYKSDGSFVTMRKEMAGALGYATATTPTGLLYLVPPPAPKALSAVDPTDPVKDAEPSSGSESEPRNSSEDDANPVEDSAEECPDDSVLDVFGAEDLEDRLFPAIPIDWRSYLPKESYFLRPWMEVCCEDDLPEEFYFWLGLVALGFAAGNGFVLQDYKSVRGNLLLCLVGSSGAGKSRSISALENLLHEAFPFSPDSGGVRVLAGTGSGESMIDEFCVPLYDDPTEPTKITGYCPVSGLAKIDEFKTLIEKANRQGNTLKTTIMELYDSPMPIATRSRATGRAEARDHFFTCISGTQPSQISKLMSAQDAMSGFGNRWVFANGVHKTLRSYGGTPLDVSSCVPLIGAISAWCSMTGPITMDADALEIWDEYFHAELVPLKMRDDTPMFVRLDLLMKKLMVLFAADTRSNIVTPEIVVQVIGLTDYLKNSYGFVERETTIPADVRAADDLEEVLMKAARTHRKQTGKDASYGDMTRRISPSVRKKNGRSALMKALKTLVMTGELEEWIDKKDGKGRPTVRYTVTK